VEEIIVTVGEPATQILELCEKKDFDLIVLGAHGNGQMVDALLGSTVQRVIRRATVPTLVVRMPEDV